MGTLHHILFSRALAVVAFCAFLILTPRAWVEDSFSEVDQVPVNVLDGPVDCLWCDTASSAPCDDTETTQARPWLNPDDSAKPLQLPCSRKLASSPHS